MLVERPAHVFPYQGRVVVLALPQGGDDCRRTRRVAERHREVAQPALETDAPDGAAARAIRELRFGPDKQRRQLRADRVRGAL